MEKTLAIVCIVILSTTGILMLAGNVHVVIVKKGAVQLPSVSNQYTPVRKMRESVPNLTEEELVSIAVKSVSKANLVHQIDL